LAASFITYSIGATAAWRLPQTGRYQAFLDLLVAGKDRAQIEMFGFCLMPKPLASGPASARRPATSPPTSRGSPTRTSSAIAAHYSQTSGHLYQGRYKSFPVEEDAYC